MKFVLFLIAISYTFMVFSSVQYIEQEEQRKQEERKIKIEYEIAEIIKEEEMAKEKEPELIKLGEFELTAYCPCYKCCGEWSGGNTASGTKPTVNRTVAVDTSVIPFGTEVVIGNNTYIAEDTGSAIKGNKIDIYMASHEEALEWGVQHMEVFMWQYY